MAWQWQSLWGFSPVWSDALISDLHSGLSLDPLEEEELDVPAGEVKEVPFEPPVHTQLLWTFSGARPDHWAPGASDPKTPLSSGGRHFGWTLNWNSPCGDNAPAAAVEMAFPASNVKRVLLEGDLGLAEQGRRQELDP